MAANPVGSVIVGDSPHFWAAPFEQGKDSAVSTCAPYPRRRAGVAAQRSCGAVQYDTGSRGDQRPPRQAATAADCDHGANRPRTRHLPRPHAARRRCRVRAFDWRNRASRPDRNSHPPGSSSSQHTGPRRRPRHLPRKPRAELLDGSSRLRDAFSLQRESAEGQP